LAALSIETGTSSEHIEFPVGYGWKVNDHRLTAGGFGLRLKAGLIGQAADYGEINFDAVSSL
jgi:hypothetical protein